MLLLVLLSGVMQAQVIDYQNTYRVNDLLEEKQITFPVLSDNTENVVWDISDMTVENERYQVENESPTETISPVVGVKEQDTRYLYELRGDSLLLTGFENHLTLMEYDKREAYLHFPMVLGDSIMGQFHGIGKYCDRLGLRSYGTYKTKADATGCLVLAEGDTLRHVLRLHTERLLTTEVFPIEQLDSLLSYSSDSIISHIAADTAQIRMDIYRWYAEGYRYPVLETRRRSDRTGENILSALAYYYAPSEQAALSNDPENEQKRPKTRGLCDNGNRFPEADIPNHFSYDLKPSDDNLHVVLQYFIPKESTISYRLYTLNGYLLFERQPTTQSVGTYIDRISLQDQRNGVFLLDFNIGETRLSEKITINH